MIFICIPNLAPFRLTNPRETSNTSLDHLYGQTLRPSNQLFESEKDSNTQKKIQWYHYNLTLVSNCYQDWYQGINIFGKWYHYNLALVPSKSLPHAREIFQHIKWPNYPRLSPLIDSNGWTPRQAPVAWAITGNILLVSFHFVAWNDEINSNCFFGSHFSFFPMQMMSCPSCHLMIMLQDTFIDMKHTIIRTFCPYMSLAPSFCNGLPPFYVIFSLWWQSFFTGTLHQTLSLNKQILLILSLPPPPMCISLSWIILLQTQ